VFNKYLQNQKGMVIPLTLMVFMVVMILGVTVLSISDSDYRHSMIQEQSTQAYYLAKSGAQTMATYLIGSAASESFNSLEQLIADIANRTSDPVVVGEGHFVIRVDRRIINGQEMLDIISTGNYKGRSDTVTATLLVNRQAGRPDFNPTFAENAVTTLSNGTSSSPALQLTGSASIVGNVAINTTGEDSIRFASQTAITGGSLFIPQGMNPHFIIRTDRGSQFGALPAEYPDHLRTGTLTPSTWINNWAFWDNIAVKPNGVKFMPMPVYPSTVYPMLVFPIFPEFTPNNNNFTTPWTPSESYVIAQDSFFNAIQPSGGRTVTVDLAGGDRILRVRDLDLTGGNLALTNVGTDSRLHIYVERNFRLGSSRTLNIAGVPNNVHIYYSGTNAVTIDGASAFRGNLFIQHAAITVGASANTQGNIVSLGSSVTVSGAATGNSLSVYAPLALVTRSGSGQINGSIISARYSASGGVGGVAFSPSQHSIPGDFFGNATQTITINFAQNPWR